MKKKIAYWIATALIALPLLASGFASVTGAEELMNVMTHLGYPAYFATIIGVWKLLGAVALLVPGFARIKEWAYAGIGFNMTGAFFSHLAAGDPVAQALPPLVLLTFAVGSYLLRPASRRLDATEDDDEGSSAVAA